MYNKLTLASLSYNKHIIIQKYARLFSAASALFLFIILSLAVYPIVLKDSSAEATTGTSIPSTTTLTMDLGSSSANLNIIPKDSNGTFSSSTSTELAQFGVTTNNYTGYTLTIAGSDDDRLLTNTDTTITTNNTLASIDSAMDNSTFDTATYNGKWGYQPSKYNSETNTDFLPAPTTTASTLDVTSTANNETNSYTIGLGARIDYTKSAGTYTNTFILSVVGNPVSYVVTYSDNTGDSSVSGLPTSTSGSTDITSITLSPVTPTRTGYTFKSWCLGTVSSNGTVCDGTEYNAGANFGIDQTTENITTLYAVWENNLKAMQDFTAADANAMSEGDTATLKDSRDNQNYTVTKINNDIWMTRNLAVGCNGNGNSYGDTVSSKSLTSSNSNVSTTWSTPTDLLSTAANSSAEAGYTTAAIECDSTYGAWYNYAAATAGTISGESNYTDATYDICPKGWRLPTRDEFEGITSSDTAFSPVAGGYYNNGSLNVTSYGFWWSATSGGHSGNLLYYDGSSLDTSGSIGLRYYGSYVRCIKEKPVIEKLQEGKLSMQDITNLSSEDKNTLMSQMTEGTSYNSTDERDNQVYTIAKIDNDIWMTRNLAIGCNGNGNSYGDTVSSKSLASYNSNVSTDWSTPTALLSTAANSSAEAGYTTAAIECDSTYGAWYNYAAATAGTISGESNITDATYDICPKGWRLPTYDEFSGITSSFTDFGPVVGGFYDYGSLELTSHGFWWSATTRGADSRYILNYYGSSLDNSFYRYNGSYVRCIKDKPAIEKLQEGRLSMQNITNLSSEDKNTLMSQMTEGTSYNSTDKRDNQVYTIAKINNNIWMTRNLAIGCNGDGSTYGDSVSSKRLTSYSSNVSTDWSTPTDLLSTAANSSETSGYTTAAMQCDATYGAWYNYKAATAGTISGESNTTDATKDICPKGWRLPTKDEFNEFNGTTISVTAFSPVAGGYYSDGSLKSTSNSRWWAATSLNATYRYGLAYAGSSLGAFNGTRYVGVYVRCIKS